MITKFWSLVAFWKKTKVCVQGRMSAFVKEREEGCECVCECECDCEWVCVCVCVCEVGMGVCMCMCACACVHEIKEREI